MTGIDRFPIGRTADGHWHVYGDPARTDLGPAVALPNVTTWNETAGTRPVIVNDVADLGRISRDRALAIRDAIRDVYTAGWYDGRDSERAESEAQS